MTDPKPRRGRPPKSRPFLTLPGEIKEDTPILPGLEGENLSGKPIVEKGIENWQAFGPSKSISAATREAVVRETDRRKQRSVQAGFVPERSSFWRQQQSMWANMTEDERKDAIYGLVLISGAIRKTDITRYFQISHEELAPYKPIIEMAKVALRLKINENLISVALTVDNATNAKELVAIQFGEMSRSPVHEGVESEEDSGKVELNINVLGSSHQPALSDQRESNTLDIVPVPVPVPLEVPNTKTELIPR